MAKHKVKIVILSLISALLVGCGGQALFLNNDENHINNEEKIIGNEIDENKKTEEESKKDTDNKIEEEKNNTESNENSNVESDESSIDLSLRPNEAGQIMVVMYHGIDEKEATWVRTPENFRKDLEELYNKGYRPISLSDFVNNNINVEAGFTPVVITFDDGNLNNFNIIGEDENKKPIIDPNCAVAILEEFNKNHPDFPLEVTFFLNGKNPFRQLEYIEYKLNYIIEKGMDIGNHTIGHNNLSKTNDKNKIQEYIGTEAKYLESFVKNYKVNTIALPFGGRPEDKDLNIYLSKGSYDGLEYENIAVLNVGWMPSVSPIDKKFNNNSIHRVRASEMNVDGVGMYDWMSVFEKHPERRFISDGNPSIITVPKKYEDKVDNNKINDKKLYIYNK